jgi:hypothetical protein
MLHYLGGGSKHSASEFYGRKIVAAELVKDKPRGSLDSSPDESLRLTFEDGTKIAIWDDGQSCCESRYMTTDDDVQSLVGHRLARIEAKDGPSGDADYDVHETCFVEIGTDDGFVTLTNHNDHNGYYGGFGLTITVEAEGPAASTPQF